MDSALRLMSLVFTVDDVVIDLIEELRGGKLLEEFFIFRHDLPPIHK